MPSFHIRTLGLVAAVLLSCSGTVTGASAQAPLPKHPPMLFRDFFSTSPDPDWTFYNRAGEVLDGRLQIDGTYLPASSGRDGWALTHVGDPTWSDYTFSASYDSRNLGGSPSDMHGAQLFVRAQAQVVGARPGTVYRVGVVDIGTPNPTTACNGLGHRLPLGLVGLEKYVGGVLVTSVISCASYSVRGFNTAAVTAYGATITLRVNGRTVLRYVDPSPILSGGVGVGEVWETNGSYDDVRVWTR